MKPGSNSIHTYIGGIGGQAQDFKGYMFCAGPEELIESILDMEIITKAAEMLEKSSGITLASINENGYSSMAIYGRDL